MAAFQRPLPGAAPRKSLGMRVLYRSSVRYDLKNQGLLHSDAPVPAASRTDRRPEPDEAGATGPST
jgi:hypothetical protein